MSYCRYYSSIWALGLYLGVQQIAAQTLSQWQALYDQGAYCDLLVQFESQSGNLDLRKKNSLHLQLLMAKTFLEMGRWDELAQNLTNLSSVDWTREPKILKLEYDLLSARQAAQQGNWQYADSLFNFLLKNPGSDHEFQPQIYAEYGLYLLQLENQQEAEYYLLLADSTASSISAFIAKINTALAFLYLKNSRVNRSKKHFIKAKNIWESNRWTKSPNYSLFLIDYALYFYLQGDLQTADSLLTSSGDLQEQSCATPSIKGYLASARAQILFGLGNYEEAIPKYQAAWQFFVEALNHKDAAIALFQIGEANYLMGHVDAAQDFYLAALDLVDMFFPNRNNALSAQILLELAGVEEYNYNDLAADSLYALSLQIMKDALGKKNALYGTALNNYARFKEVSGDVAGAIRLYHQTATLDSLLLGANHPDYKTTLYNLARSYSKIDSVHQALAYYRKANSLQLKLLNHYFGNFDASARLSYRLEAMGNFDVFFSYACSIKNEGLSAEIEDINLVTKNLALDYAREFQGNPKPDQNAEEDALYQEWLRSRKLLAEMYFASNPERKELDLSIDSIEQRVNDLEKIITRRNNSSLNKSRIVNTSHVIAKLTDHEAAIDFFNYYVTDEYGRLPDSILYYASIMTATQESPKLIYLCSQRVLDEILTSSSHYTYNVDVNHLLYQTIWAPLEEFLGDAQKIHLSPEGLLHQISFAALLPDATRSETLLDRFDFYYYSNLRDFVLPGKEHKKIASIYLVGDPDFGKAVNVGSEYASGYFSDLPETAEEISNISSLFANLNIHIKLELGTDANEPSFYKNLITFRPSILHLATHGFFYSKDTSLVEPRTLGERIRSSEIPLLRSGIVLSEVNHFWGGVSNVPPSSDGIVTAQEISNLDLSETELVVLSACETGRGGVADGEGVFGLQRAFKLAGISQLLISLWDVPDTATSALMTNFYQFLIAGLTPHEALLEAQRALKLLYPNPYDWAAFVLFQ